VAKLKKIKLKRVKTESLRSRVYMQLKQQLMQGVWKAGERLPSEHEFCETLGVSRVTIRAAIQQLEILGLVETQHGGGTFVRDFSTIDAMDALHPMLQVRENHDIITVLEYRKIIEKGTVGLVVSKLTDKDIEYFEKTYSLMVKYDLSGEREKQANADHAFHYRLAQIAQNPIILKVYELIKVIMSAAMVDIVGLLGTEIGLRYHRMLIDALSNRDKALCESLMEAHIEETIQAVLRATQQTQDESIVASK
jgi:GntR family transcriptional regulator, transcriptional repressor for pyruvate dehydrogenase complex